MDGNSTLTHAGGKIKTTSSAAKSGGKSGLRGNAREDVGYTAQSVQHPNTEATAREGVGYTARSVQRPSVASIAELLRAVKECKNISLEGVLFEDVKKAPGSTAARPKEFGKNLCYQLNVDGNSTLPMPEAK